MAREYCCCAIPIVNFGIYLTLLEQFIAGTVAGTLALATPRVVAYSAPSFGPWIFAGLCYVIAAVQLLGFIGVSREKASLFSTFSTLHYLFTLGAFSVAAVFIGLSASQHQQALTTCESQFFASTDDPTGASNTEGQIVCDAFAWAGIGILAGLWVVMGIMQAYLCSILAAYSSSQRADAANYYSIYAANDALQGGPNDFILAERGPKASGNDPWDTRDEPFNAAGVGARARSVRGNNYSHVRTESSASDALPPGAAAPAIHSRQGTRDFGGARAPGPRRQGTSDSYSHAAPPPLAIPARTANETPTPVGSTYPTPYRPAQGDMRVPEQSKFHPAEGSFGRKTPRLEVAQPYPFAPEFQSRSPDQSLR